MMRKPEILAPAGDFTCLEAALQAGADAVYLGLGGFNMRARASVNFSREDLPEIRRRLGARKLYLTLNAIVFEDELAEVENLIVYAKPYVDAFIVADWGVIALCRRHGAVFHVSTQMSCSNSAAAAFLAAQGAERVVLARECTLAEVSRIISEVNALPVAGNSGGSRLSRPGTEASRADRPADATSASLPSRSIPDATSASLPCAGTDDLGGSRLSRPGTEASRADRSTDATSASLPSRSSADATSASLPSRSIADATSASLPLEIECFVHGAQCVAESGRCLMSHEAFGCSANRGECHQPCRRRFLVKAVDLYEDEAGNPVHESDTAYVVEPHTVLSAKDLCSLPFVDKLMAAGIASFKIEGRARNAEYVKTVVGAYRRAVDAVADGTYTPALVAELTEEVKKVFHREFSVGLYYGRPGADQFTDSEDSLATTVKRHVGIVIDYFLKAGIVQVKVQDHAIRPGDLVQIHGPTTGVQELTVGELRRDEERPAVAEKGTWVTFAAPRCRVGDKVFFIETRG